MLDKTLIVNGIDISDCPAMKLLIYSASVNTIQGVVYCLDKNFLNIAIQEIGEERLKKYLRGEA